MSNTSITLVNLDFESLKSSFKQYLKDSQPLFKDYDFEGSNINVLLDLLSYNSSLNAFYLNMIASEMFMDSAQLRDSVVSHAKLLNYTPRSFQSARATVNIVINVGNTGVSTLTIPKGTTFTGKGGSNNYNFVTRENIVAVYDQSNTQLLLANNCVLYEGSYVSENFVYNSNTSVYTLSNPNIDTDSISIAVIEDNANVIPFTRATSLFGLQSNTQAYFLQGGSDETYEILFGDGIIGRTPKENSIIVAEYTVCNGELPNGVNKFTINGDISGYSNIAVTTISSSAGGSISESAQSIKANAPRYFNTQERAITTSDYENLLKIQYPEINTVVAYGGEEETPPQYGKVFVAIDLKSSDGLPDIKKKNYYTFLKARSALSIDPVIVEPDYMYLSVESLVRFNPNITLLNENDIQAAVLNTIQTFNSTFLDDFNVKFRYSKFVSEIDNADSSILSNDTVVNALKIITPPINISQNYTIDFQQEIGHDFSDVEQYSTVYSSNFYSKNVISSLRDDGVGNLNLVFVDEVDGSTTVLDTVGTVNYLTGSVAINNLTVQSFSGSGIKIYARIRQKDIFSFKKTILTIKSEDIVITAVKQAE